MSAQYNQSDGTYKIEMHLMKRELFDNTIFMETGICHDRKKPLECINGWVSHKLWLWHFIPFRSQWLGWLLMIFHTTPYVWLSICLPQRCYHSTGRNIQLAWFIFDKVIGRTMILEHNHYGLASTLFALSLGHLWHILITCRPSVKHSTTGIFGSIASL